MERLEIINKLYEGAGEDTRLSRSRHGQLEYLTTMSYIHALVPPGSRVLEVGAGTGRYSVALAEEGHEVTALELAEPNLALLRQKTSGLDRITALRGDAVDLGAFTEGSFDAVLLLGPMYHLYEKEEQHRALDEAIRVARPGGVIMAAFLSVYQILLDNYLSGNLKAGLEENFDRDFQVRHFKEQVFTGFTIEEFEALFSEKPVRKIALAGTDSLLELAENAPDFWMSDEDFDLFARYHLKTCEVRELLGSQAHLLYICQKNK